MSLNPRFVLGSLDLTDYPFMVEFGADLGNPENIAEIIDSLLQDGEVVSSTRSSNRVLTLPVLIDQSGDMLALAKAEAALALECDKQRSTLAIDPGDGIAPVTVFDTFRAQATFRRDDDEEINGYRRYVLTIPALPFGRSVDEVTTPALTAGAGVDTAINACDALTGWTALDGATLAVDTTQKIEGTGSIKVTPTGDSWEQISGDTWRMGQVGKVSLAVSALDFTATPYLQVSAWTAYTDTHTIQAFVDGVEAPLTAKRHQTTDPRWTAYHFYVTDASVSTVRFEVSQTNVGTYPGGPTGSGPFPTEFKIRLDDVRRTAAIPTSSSTGRQATRTIEVLGSARTVGSLSVAGSAGLGDVLVYTSPNLGRGYTPDLSRWRASGPSAPVADAATISGSRATLHATIPEVFEFPANPLPRGGYLLVGRMETPSATARRLTYTVGTIVGSLLVGSRTYTSRVLPSTATGVRKFVTLGGLILPPTDVPPGSTNLIRLSITDPQGVNPVPNAIRDEFYILSMADGAALSIVNCGGVGATTLGSANSRLWLDAPSLGKPTPTAWLGTAADRSDAYHAGDAADSWDLHTFAPPGTDVFIANSGAGNPAVTLRHHPRWHTNAGR